MTSRIPESTDWEWFLLISRSKPRATQQFDSGRREFHSKRVPVSAVEQSNSIQPWIPQPSQRLLPLVGQLLAALLRLARFG